MSSLAIGKWAVRTSFPRHPNYPCTCLYSPGALLNEVPADDNAANFDFFGSTVVCKGESKEAVLEQLKKDIYATSGVWDVEKVPWAATPCATVLAANRRRSKSTPSSAHSETHKRVVETCRHEKNENAGINS